MLQHALEQKKILNQLGIWEYLTGSEIKSFKECENDYQVDRLARTYREKYWDQMMYDYDHRNVIESDVSESVDQANIAKKVKYILLRNKIKTSDDFLDVMMTKGWNSIRGLGETSAKIVIKWVLPDEDVSEYLKKYKVVKE